MTLQEEFDTAAKDVQKLPERPGNDQLLALYSLFKQSTEGDAKGSRPGLFDLVGRKKYDAWAAKKGMPADEAKRQYIALVKQLSGG